MWDLIAGIVSSALYDMAKWATKESGGLLRRGKGLFRRNPTSFLFVPEAVAVNHEDQVNRKVMVRLILHGSPTWTRGGPVTMKPDFKAIIFPPGNGNYDFTGTHAFTTPPIPKGLHAYFLGEQELKPEHKDVELCKSKVGVIFSGWIDVEGIGRVPVFPVTLLAGCLRGFVNEPIELRALKAEGK